MTGAAGRRADVAVVLCCLVIGAGLALATLSSRSVAGNALDLAAGAVACAALFRRRRAPLVVAVALVPLDVVSFAGTAAYLVAIGTVAARRGPRAAVLVALAHLAAAVLGAWVTDPEQSLWTVAAAAAVVLAATVALGLYTGARRALVASLQERARHLEETRARDVARAKQAERLRIAGEMHDVLAHRLSLVSLHAGALQLRTAALDDEAAAASDLVRQTARTAVQELRDVIGVLRDPGGDGPVEPPQPTLREVAGLVASSREAGVEVDYDLRLSDAEVSRCPDALGRHAHRVVQEALTNVHKHTDRAATRVVVAGAPDAELRVEVRNGLGPAIPSGRGNGLGLVSLEERVRAAGGRFDAGRERGEFVVRARWPWS